MKIVFASLFFVFVLLIAMVVIVKAEINSTEENFKKK